MIPAEPSPPPPPAPTVVGIGADGWQGLPEDSRAALLGAQVVIGGARQLELLPPQCTGRRVPWPSPLRPAVAALLTAHQGLRIAVLASGDPMFYGIGRALCEELGAENLRVLPHPSSVPTPAPGSAGRWRTPRSSPSSAARRPGWPPPCTTAGGCWC